MLSQSIPAEESVGQDQKCLMDVGSPPLPRVSNVNAVSASAVSRRSGLTKKQSAKATLAEVIKEMAKPRVATSARE